MQPKSGRSQGVGDRENWEVGGGGGICILVYVARRHSVSRQNTYVIINTWCVVEY